MTRLFIWTLFLFSCSVYGQDNAATKVRKFYIGANFSPDYCDIALTKDSNMGSVDWRNIKQLLDSIYIPKFGYTTGLALGYQFNDHIGIETGVQYSNKGYKTIPWLTFYDPNKPPAIATSIITYSYIDIPLKANILFLKRRTQIIASVGAVLNCLLQVKVKQIPQTPTTDFQTYTFISDYPTKKTNLSPTIGIGVKYKINDLISIRAEPNFRFGLFKTDDDYIAAKHLWALGLNVGFYFGL